MRDRQFELLLHDVGHRERNLKAIAYLMGIPYSTLAEQLNPEVPVKQLKAASLPDFIRAADDNRPIEYLCHLRNLVVFPAPTESTAMPEISGRVAKAVKEFGEMLTEIGQSLADGRLTEQERARCRQETYEVLQAVAALWFILGGEDGE